MQKLFKSTSPKGKRREAYQAEFKRRVVEESLAPGASVRLIARQNNISASAVYKWRLEHCAQGGVQGAQAPGHYHCNGITSGTESASLLSVQVVDEPLPQSVAAPERHRDDDLCEVEFDRARLRLRGDVSPCMLRLLIQELSR